jgi:hypothetical protein
VKFDWTAGNPPDSPHELIAFVLRECVRAEAQRAM